jgi:hypothetical protein
MLVFNSTDPNTSTVALGSFRLCGEGMVWITRESGQSKGKSVVQVTYIIWLPSAEIKLLQTKILYLTVYFDDGDVLITVSRGLLSYSCPIIVRPTLGSELLASRLPRDHCNLFTADM